MKTNNYFWMASMALALVACNDDLIDDMPVNDGNNAPAREESASALIEDVKVYPLLYNNFQSAHDVEITAADTSSMLVKTALLDAMRIDLEPGNVLSVWTAPDEIPFMRRVENMSKEGSYYRLQTCNVGLDEVLKEAHLEFDSEIYTNGDEQPRNGDGTINDRFYQSERDGVYHPTALWYHTEQEDAQLRGRSLTRGGGADEDVLTLGYDRERTLIVEDMGKTRASVELGINFKAEVKEKKQPIVLNEDTIAVIGLQKAEFMFKGGLHARLDCSIWNGVERFEVGPYYSIEGHLNAGISMDYQLFKLQKEYTIAECQGFTSCFWVGPVPVVVSFTPSVVFNAELKGNAKGAIGAKVDFSGNRHAYACYEPNRGWYIDEGGQDFNSQAVPYAGGTFGLEFKTGLYAKAAVSLYGVVGPTLSVGPYFKAKAEASIDLVNPDLAAKVSAHVGVGGKVGAQLKIWRWDLGKWEQPFNILEKSVLDKSYSMQEWMEMVAEAEEILPGADASEDWAAAQAEVEREKRYQEGLDDLIHDNEKTLQRFIDYMSPLYEITDSDTDWYNDHPDYVNEWKNIKEQNHTFYNWPLEYAFWRSDALANTEMMQQISEHIAKDIDTKTEILSNVRRSSIYNAFLIYVETGTMSAADALKKYNIPAEQALIDDLVNIRDEREKHLEYGRKTGTISEELQRDYFTPWYNTFLK